MLMTTRTSDDIKIKAKELSDRALVMVAEATTLSMAPGDNCGALMAKMEEMKILQGQVHALGWVIQTRKEL